MPNTALCLEALSALSGCNVELTSGASQLTAQDFVNIVALKEFYKQEGFKQLEYPSLGTLSLQDEDLYSSPPALTGPMESLKTMVKINPDDFFHPEFNYNFTHIKVRRGFTWDPGDKAQTEILTLTLSLIIIIHSSLSISESRICSRAAVLGVRLHRCT